MDPHPDSPWSQAFPRRRGTPLLLTNHGKEAAEDLRITAWDVADLLEGSQDCAVSRRQRGIEERCVPWKSGKLRIVVARSASGWLDSPEAWIVINIKPLPR